MSSCSIVSNFTLVFPDVEERIAKYFRERRAKWDEYLISNNKAPQPVPFQKIYENNLLTDEERRNFDETKPPVWIDRITLKLLQNNDIEGEAKYPGIYKFSFRRSLTDGGDAEFWIKDSINRNERTIRVSHDNLSGRFAVHGY